MMNTNNSSIIKRHSRSKSVGETDVDPEFAKILVSKRIDAFEDNVLVKTKTTMSKPDEIIYEEIPDIMDSLFDNIVNVLINILPHGSAIMGGTAHVLMSKKFGIKPLHYLNNIIKRNKDSEEQYTFKRDIDIILTKSMYFEDIKYYLEQIGQIEFVTTMSSYHGHKSYRNLRYIRKLTSIKLKIPLRTDAIKKMTKGMLSFFIPFFSNDLFDKFPQQFVVDMDFVEVNVDKVSELATKWFVSNELRMYALMIYHNDSESAAGSAAGSAEGSAAGSEVNKVQLIPMQISSIMPSSLTKKNGKIIIPLNIIFDYIKGLCWETSLLPGRTRSGMLIPSTTTKPLKNISRMDMIVRLANIHSDNAIIHVAVPDIWIPHIVYDSSLTVDTIKDTFNFGKLNDTLSDDEKEIFQNASAKRIFNHIHDKNGYCCICMGSLIEPGTSFMALPCGCTSVMHMDCFLNNYLLPAITQVMNNVSGKPDKKLTECPLCRMLWWKVKKPERKIKFRVLNDEYSMYYNIDKLLQGTIFQLYNTKLYDQLMSDPKSTDFQDFIE